MASKVDTRLVVRLPIVCMYKAHGHLTGYQDADGRISVKPCQFCLNTEAVIQIAATDKAWRARVRKAIDA